MADGRVTVGGEVVTDPARDVDETSGVALDGEPVKPEPHEVHALNKPAGVVSTARDTHGRPTVVQLVRSRRRLYPVGRLDADTTGLILLTNDGDLADRLTHPRYGVKKVYRARIQPARLSPRAFEALREGVELEDGRTAPAQVRQPAPGRAGADDPGGPQATGPADGARRSATGWSSSSGWRSARWACAASTWARAAASRRPRWSVCAGYRSRAPSAAGARSRAIAAPVTASRKRRRPAAATIRRRMQLRALRGAITVEENEADAILSATEELMREVMQRNSLEPDQMVSCIFTCTNDLDAEFPAVAARRLGLSAVPLLCAREIDVPGALPRVIRLLLHCYADPETEPKHVYLRDAESLRRDLQGAQ